LSALSVNAATLLALEGKEIRLRNMRTAQECPTVGVMGQMNHEVATPGGGQRYVRSVDFLVDPETLRFEGELFEVTRDFRVFVTIGATEYTYQVLPESDLPPFSMSDVDNTLVRIHTKRVA
jgi:hypothetical protein